MIDGARIGCRDSWLGEAVPVSTGFNKRLAPWFGTRRWRVRTEVTGTGMAVSGVRITYKAGEFQVGQPGVFVTPLGHRGRRGFLVIETDESGRDIIGTDRAFGESTLRRASDVYGTVSGLPQEGS